jgi:hypothetical protein
MAMSNDKLILVVDDDPDLVESVSMRLETMVFRSPKPMTAWKRGNGSRMKDRRC